MSSLFILLLPTLAFLYPTAAGKCADSSQMCKHWQNIMCNQFQEMAEKYCTKSCGKCWEISEECNAEEPCESGYICQYVRSRPGQKYCIKGADSDSARRPGRCPLPAETAQTFMKCEYHGHCGDGKKCCQNSDGEAFCMAAISVDDSTPKYTILLPGVNKNEDGVFTFIGTVALVQSKGKNILFDTAGPSDKLELLEKLGDLTGLYPEDIDYLVTSHGHLDHSGNSGVFPDTPNLSNSFTITGNKYAPNALFRKERLFINGDTNLEIIQTPGHTNQDTTLVVYNVPGKGRVALAGDLFLSPEDYKTNSRFNELQQGSRKRVACEYADWIVPGHGPEFQVTEEVKESFGC